MIQRGLPGLLVALLVVVASVSAADKAPRTSLDAQGRLLIHGVPRFVLGVYDSGFGYAHRAVELVERFAAMEGK